MPTLLAALDLLATITTVAVLVVLLAPLPWLLAWYRPARVRARRRADVRRVVRRAVRVERSWGRYWAERAGSAVAPPPRPGGGVTGDGRPRDIRAIAVQALADDAARRRRRAARAG